MKIRTAGEIFTFNFSTKRLKLGWDNFSNSQTRLDYCVILSVALGCIRRDRQQCSGPDLSSPRHVLSLCLSCLLGINSLYAEHKM